jgi:hypothetical protein
VRLAVRGVTFLVVGFIILEIMYFVATGETWWWNK